MGDDLSVRYAVQLTLLRHGVTTWNDQRLIQGHSDLAQLTSVGREQVRAVLPSLSERALDCIVVSDLTRALESAQIVADALNLDLISDARLRERGFGVYEGRPLDDLDARLSGVDHDRIVDVDARPPQGESLREMRSRLVEFLGDLRRTSFSRALVVTHGGTIRVLRSICEDRDLAETLWYPVANASLWDVTG
ncbi:MAG: histidine phosphatase family protein [Acidimicrobiales bacterium]